MISLQNNFLNVVGVSLRGCSLQILAGFVYQRGCSLQLSAGLLCEVGLVKMIHGEVFLFHVGVHVVHGDTLFRKLVPFSCVVWCDCFSRMT